MSDADRQDAAIPSTPVDTTSDESLILLARAGDRQAFAELWQRHARSGVRVARQFTSSIDAEDLVSEAYASIYQRVLAGGGPDGAFRPYLYTTIRNLASRWGRSRKDVNVDDIGEFEDPEASDDPATVALDRTLTAKAFRSLPERWQSVLWYTEVEGMDPHEVAPILGISANGVAALSYRAREGLRRAWLQAHVTAATASGECQWAISRLGDHARHSLTPRDTDRIEAHLDECAKCQIISEEVEEVGSRLALVMLPLLLGGVAGGAFLASISSSGSASAAAGASATLHGAVSAGATSGAAAGAAPALPAAFTATGAVGAVAAPVTAGLSVAAVSAPLVAVIGVALAVSGGLAVASTSAPEVTATPPAAVDLPAASTASAPSEWTIPSLTTVPGISHAPAASPVGGLHSTVGALDSTLQSTVNQASGAAGTTIDGVVHDVTNPINAIIPGAAVGPGPVPEHSAPAGVAGATASLDLSGKGMPGATVSVQAAGVVYATTVVTPQGTWAVHVTALPSGVGQLQLTQTLVSVLGIDLLSAPLSVLSNSLGITLDILN